MKTDLTSALAAIVLAMAAGPALAQGVERSTGLKISGDEPIQIESDRLEVRENEGLAVFEGNVAVVQGETTLRAGKMTVYYSGDGEGGVAEGAGGAGDIERLELEDKVYVRSENQVATGDRGNFDMRSEILEMTGEEVVLTEGDNVIVGCKLVVQMATGLANLEGCGEGGGRVRMLLQPDSQDR